MVSTVATTTQTSSMRTQIIGLTIAFLVIVVGIAIWLRATSSNRGEAGASTPRRQVATDQVVVPRVANIDVGTEWYRPNHYNVALHVFGHPTVNNVSYRARKNFDDRTIVHMGPINGPRDIPEIKGDGPVEYSVEPGQAVTHCTFHFQFDPVQ